MVVVVGVVDVELVVLVDDVGVVGNGGMSGTVEEVVVATATDVAEELFASADAEHPATATRLRIRTAARQPRAITRSRPSYDYDHCADLRPIPHEVGVGRGLSLAATGQARTKLGLRLIHGAITLMNRDLVHADGADVGL